MGADKKWLLIFLATTFISVVFLFLNSGFRSSYYYAFSSRKSFALAVHRGPGYPSVFAYHISGSRGDGECIFRLLMAVYHHRKRYLLHIAADGTNEERTKLVGLVKSVPAVQAFGNVDVIGKPDRITYMGSTNIAIVLRVGSILLKLDGGWDWFITLSALDYPLVTQDGELSCFENVVRFASS